MVAAVLGGKAQRAVARKFRVALSTLQYWIGRGRGRPLEEVEWEDRPPIPRKTSHTHASVEDVILSLRKELKESSDLGEYGAVAVRREIVERGISPVPSVRTIGRVFVRRGALDARKRIRRPPPPLGWYLPDLARRDAELDAFDVVEGLLIQGGPLVEVLNGISLHGGLVASWPSTAATAQGCVEALLEHWRQFGVPTYVQFDNDTRFSGAHVLPDTIGRVARLCLSLGVVAVFAPPRETGFQGAIEGYNARWIAKVWSRFHHPSLAALQERSQKYVLAHRRRASGRIEMAPPRRPFPCSWRLNLQAHPQGRLIFLRRTTERGTVSLLRRTFEVDGAWPHRLTRAEVDLEASLIRFYALRRRDPTQQPLLREVPYTLPRRRYSE